MLRYSSYKSSTIRIVEIRRARPEAGRVCAADALKPLPSLDCSWLSRNSLNSSTFSSSIHSLKVC